MRRSILGIVFLVFAITSTAVARTRRSDPFEKPQFGLWFGTVTPVYTTDENLDTYLGGGLFMRTNSFIRGIKFGLDSSYQFFRSQSVNELTLIPIYGSFIYRLPINMPLAFQLKIGGGGARLYFRPDDVTAWEPLFMCGFETSFPAGRVFNIGLRIDYLLIYEQYIERASRNGHIVNAGITVFFNIGE
ncbi:MAG: hypothetical protein N2316_00885 [Spirochaetes bacterium]|nr:hypothetical protein [Spirochaetota bacterium]